MTHHDAAQPGRICPVQAGLAGQALKLTGFEDDGGADPAAYDDARRTASPVEQISKGDLAVAVDGIALQRHRAGEGGTRKGQGQRGPQDQRPHDFTCEATDSIWSAVVMTLEFIS